MRLVVFRQDTKQTQQAGGRAGQKALGTIDGPWQVHFQEGAARPRGHFHQVDILDGQFRSGIKYSRDTANYETSLNAPASRLVKGHRLEIDLGQ